MCNYLRVLPMVPLLMVIMMLEGCSQQAALPPELAEAKFECKNQPVKPGQDAIIQGSLRNKGGEFKGIKITLKGNALTEGVLAMPASARSSVAGKFAAQPKLIISSAAPSFDKVDNETLEATLPDFECKGDTIDVNLAIPATKNGRGDLKVTVTPLCFPEKSISTWLTVQVRQMTGIFMGT